MKIFLRKNTMSVQSRIGRLLPDSIYLQIQYRRVMGKKLNLKRPTTFNDKMNWLKLHDRNPLYTKMVDKYEVKQYVANIIGTEYIVPTLGVWDRFDEVNFDSLPNQFVLKCTHDSGGLVVCRDKKELNNELARAKIESSLRKNFYWQLREWPYKNVKPRIIAEEYLEEHSDYGQYLCKGLTDYKFFCFNQEPTFLYVSRGLEDHTSAEISFYDLNGKEMSFHRSDFKQYHNAIMPDNFDEMKSIAKQLARSISSPFVRIDLYSINDRIYFSEITFTPCGGMLPFEPISADVELGKLVILPVDQ